MVCTGGSGGGGVGRCRGGGCLGGGAGRCLGDAFLGDCLTDVDLA